MNTMDFLPWRYLSFPQHQKWAKVDLFVHLEFLHSNVENALSFCAGLPPTALTT